MKIKFVTVLGMHNMHHRIIEFDPNVTYLYGHNGSGKSTTLQAIQLGLLGYIPGTNKRVSDIFRHSNTNMMSVMLELVDGEQHVLITRSWTKSGSKINSYVNVCPEGYDIKTLVESVELPVFNFTDFLNLSSNAKKDWFLKFLPESDTTMDWQQEFQHATQEVNCEDKQDIISELVNVMNGADSSISGLRSINARIKDSISGVRAEISALQSTIESLIYFDDAANLDKSELSRKLDEFQHLRNEASYHKYARDTNADTRKQLQEFQDLEDTIESDANYKELLVSLESYSRAINSYEDSVLQLKSSAVSCKYDSDRLDNALSGGGICPYTNQSCEIAQSQLSDMDRQRDDITHKIADLHMQIQQISKIIAEYKSARQGVESDIQSLKSRYDRKHTLESRLMPEAEVSVVYDVEWLDAQISDIQDQLTQIKANEKYQSLINDVTSKKFKLEKQLQLYKVLDKFTGVNGAQSTVMEQPFRMIENSMHTDIFKMFGETWEPWFDVSDSSNFSFGIKKSDVYVPYDLLSSGEKCRYAVALLSALVRTAESNLKLLLIDDFLDHLDSPAIDTVFSVLADTDIQIIAAGVQLPENCLHEKIHTLNMDVKEQIH